MKEKSIMKITLEQAKILEDLTDWKNIEKMSESEIDRLINCGFFWYISL